MLYGLASGCSSIYKGLIFQVPSVTSKGKSCLLNIVVIISRSSSVYFYFLM